MENILDRAIIFATEAHKGQFRKGTQIPYILHPMEAAAIVSTMTTDSEIIAGAVLHDVVEDTDTTMDDIQEMFGDTVAFLVCSETENKRKNLSAQSTWKIRNARPSQDGVFGCQDDHSGRQALQYPIYLS